MSYGRMALLEGYGIVITMTAEEKNPLRSFYKENDPVYKDSAMEAFLNFDIDNLQSRYFNFEINANGAMLSEFGSSGNRRKINELTSCTAQCEAVISEEGWQVLLKIPMDLICGRYKREPLKKGDIFSCNFYKISQDPTIEHYAAYSKVISEVPNFHLPEYFSNVQVI